MGEKLHDIGFGSDFLVMTTKAQLTKAKIHKRDYVKLKNPYSSKDTIKNKKATYQNGRKFSEVIYLRGIS